MPIRAESGMLKVRISSPMPHNVSAMIEAMIPANIPSFPAAPERDSSDKIHPCSGAYLLGIRSTGDG